MVAVNEHYLNNGLMNRIKKYRLIIAIILPVLILIIIRTFRTDSFKYDAKKWAEPSFKCSNIVSETEIGKLPGKKLIVYLDNSIDKLSLRSADEIHIPPDSLLSRRYLHKIKDHNGPVLISSTEPSLSARIWMVLSQTGCHDLYILTSSTDNEVFKNEFRPDTIVRQEL
jgi:hypothetical protein